MRLSELEPEFLHHDPEDSSIHHFVDSLQKANGIIFKCPKCFIENKELIGVHSVICWSPEVPQTVSPTPGRWSLSGMGIEDLTLVGVPSSSILLTCGCKAHFFIRNGEIIMC